MMSPEAQRHELPGDAWTIYDRAWMPADEADGLLDQLAPRRALGATRHRGRSGGGGALPTDVVGGGPPLFLLGADAGAAGHAAGARRSVRAHLG